MDLAVAKITMEFDQNTFRYLNDLKKNFGVEVIYLCHGNVPNFYLGKFVYETHIRMSASRSRNYILKKIHSSRILFLDEDSALSKAAMKFLKTFVDKGTRGHIIFSGKSQVIKPKTIFYRAELHLFRVNRYYCEWNTVYDREFLSAGNLFPSIGVGSRHEFWSGEGLCSLLKFVHRSQVHLRPEIVDHPSLANGKPLDTARKYLKGYGFSMGYIFRHGSLPLKIHSLARFCLSCLRDLILPQKVIPALMVEQRKKYRRWKVLVWKIQGIRGRG